MLEEGNFGMFWLSILAWQCRKDWRVSTSQKVDKRA